MSKDGYYLHESYDKLSVFLAENLPEKKMLEAYLKAALTALGVSSINMTNKTT